MRDRNCPNCGKPVYRTHHCRVSAVEKATPFDRAMFEQERKEARAELLAQRNAEAQLTIPLEPDFPRARASDQGEQ